ncbi:MAG: glutamate--tRNA ligase family protein, partial [OM182 bacterium]|nr:glutamate--tRNA ligase family protein [OM182 bacterium]
MAMSEEIIYVTYVGSNRLECHAGSLLAALGSWLDARKNGGKWLLRIEDLDTPRCIPGAEQQIQVQLLACGLSWDEELTYQS